MPGLSGALCRGLIAGIGLLSVLAGPAAADGDCTVFIAGQERGAMTVRSDRTGLRESVFNFVDRGRGPEMTTRMNVVADRLPPVVRRGLAGSGFATTEDERLRFVASYARMGQFLKRLHDAGVPIVAGTDGGAASLTLVHELELYVAAGLSPADALYTATLGAAKVVGAEGRFGSIEPGKAADLLLVEGDPSRDLGDLRKGVMVLKDGVVFEPDALYRAVGIAPSKR